jgi:predicted DNA-binding transcriptional regulator YafY
MTPSKTSPLILTSQERAALSIALKTTLQLWGNSEDAAQERVRKKLQTVLRKLDALDVSAVAAGK